MIPGSASAEFFGAAGAAAGGGAYEISRSLRFSPGDSSFLSRTPASATNQQTWTWSAWVKRSALATQQIFFDAYTSQSDTGYLFFGIGADDKLFISGWNTVWKRTTQVFRDPSAWLCLTVAFDVTQATGTNRIKFFVNGTQITTFDTDSAPSQNTNHAINGAYAHNIGRYSQGPSQYFSGYLADVFLIDGQALDPSSFTTTDLTTGQLIPKAYTGSYGTNGFKLNFSDNSTAAALGTDTSGNGNTWTVNNFSVTAGFDSVSFPSSGGPPTVDYLVVAGGGAGGGRVGGGGGAGGLLTGSSLAVTAGTSYNLLVGQGGTGSSGSGSVGGKGVNSIFGNLIAQGGGGGGTSNNNTGLDGGSGGGASNFPTSSAGGVGTAGQGNNGGAGTSGANGCAGGGGSSSVGGSGGGAASGNGGSGTAVSITGSSVTYAGGGGGGAQGGTPGTGTNGGGNGTADNSTAGAGAVNTGSGGGGGGYASEPGGTGGAGGSGVVIIRYSDTYANLSSISAGLTYTLTVSGGYKIYRFTASTQYSPSIAAGNDSLVDTPTSYGTDTGVGGEVRGNYATWNPLKKVSSATAVNGNLAFTVPADGGIASTFAVSSGKWYWEVVLSSGRTILGLATTSWDPAVYPGNTAQGWGYSAFNGNKIHNASSTSYGSSFTTSDVIGVAFDADAGTLTFYKNGTSQGQAFSGITGSVYQPALGGDGGTTGAGDANFGQRAFAYTAPSGFKALVDTNLPTPVVAKGSSAMDVVTYAGNGSTRTISGLQFSPDLIWIKSRSNSSTEHTVADTVRGLGSSGAYYRLFTNTTDSELNDGYDVTAITSTGFSLTNGFFSNNASQTYVAWTWDAGTSTVTNTAGSITSQVRANPSAGFSVLTYTGTGPSATIGHGLGVAPGLVIVKRRDASGPVWAVYHSALGPNKILQLQTTDAAGTYSGYWGTPNSSTFGIISGSDIATGGGTYVGYCWAPVSGYSSFGSYTGNGSTDGPFVYTGFRPRWIMFKFSSGSGGDWFVFDSARNTYNYVQNVLYPNASTQEQTSADGNTILLLSNGFKLNNVTYYGWNGNGSTYIYAAFAENPFQYARAR